MLIVLNILVFAFSLFYFVINILKEKELSYLNNISPILIMASTVIVFVLLKHISVQLAANTLVTLLVVIQGILMVLTAANFELGETYTDEFYFILIFYSASGLFGSRKFLIINALIIVLVAVLGFFIGNYVAPTTEQVNYSPLINFIFALIGLSFVLLAIQHVTHKAIDRSNIKAHDAQEKNKQLIELIDAFEETSEYIMTHTDSLYNSAFELSESSNNQAQFISDMTKAIKSLTGSISDNAQKAQESNKKAEENRSSVEKTVKALNNIIESVTSVKNQVDSIDYISFQSGILSLNAAIQASKVGEYGKGFSAISEEMRRLADNSKQANQTIAEISETNSNYADEAVKAVTELETVISSAIDGNKVIYEKISDQKYALESLNIFAEQINIYAQKNALLSDKFNNSAKSLVRSLRKLNKLLLKTRMKM